MFEKLKALLFPKANNDFEVTRIKISSGDVVVISTDRHLTIPQSEEIAKVTREQFPDNQILILTNGYKLMVINKIELQNIAERMTPQTISPTP